jgi:hypothetical protein
VQEFKKNARVMIVLVRDMWLTGFDAPSLHTMYVDKPMRGHALMQSDRPGQPRVQGQVLAWFKARGAGWQDEINGVLAF